MCVTHDRETSFDFALLETISAPLVLFDELFGVDNTALSPLSNAATNNRLTKHVLCVSESAALTKQFLREKNTFVSFVDNFPRLRDQLAYTRGHLPSSGNIKG